MKVDTGRARSGWYASVAGLNPSSASRKNWSAKVKTDDPKAISEGKRKGSFVNKLKGRGSKYVELINGVGYMIFLEYGSSSQAPAGIVRIAMAKMKGGLPTLMNDEYLANWHNMGF